MANMLDSLMDQLGGGNLDTLSRSVGADKEATRDALAAALPTILAGLAKNSASADGAAALDNALAKDHDGGLLDDLSGFLRQGQTANGEGILRHVFGDKQEAVETAVSKSSGIDAAKAAKLLAMAAPIIMAYLGRKRQQEQLDPSTLGRVLKEQNQSVQKASPQLGGLASILDADRDGSVADDIAAGLGKLFRR
ncbi:MAG: DUF937 domain-containing protein [Longimicrobiales bacterium]